MAAPSAPTREAQDSTAIAPAWRSRAASLGSIAAGEGTPPAPHRSQIARHRRLIARPGDLVELPRLLDVDGEEGQRGQQEERLGLAERAGIHVAERHDARGDGIERLLGAIAERGVEFRLDDDETRALVAQQRREERIALAGNRGGRILLAELPDERLAVQRRGAED